MPGLVATPLQAGQDRSVEMAAVRLAHGKLMELLGERGLLT